MPRPTIQINKDSFTAIIADLETKKTYRNHSELFKDVSSVYNDKHQQDGITLTPAIVYLRVKEWAVALKTQKGKKGRQKGEQLNTAGVTSVVRLPRGEKFASSDLARQSIGKLRQEVKREQKGRFLPLVNRLEKGSMKAAVALKCIDCCAGSTTDIKHCPCTSCSLYLFRPYQDKEEISSTED